MSKLMKINGLPVIDSTRDLNVDVQVRDIKQAKKNDPGNCAIAKAIKRETGKDAKVFLTRTYVKEKDHWERYTTPLRASREIVSFDRSQQFDPGNYKVNCPGTGQTLRYQRGYQRPRKTRKTWDKRTDSSKPRSAPQKTKHVRVWSWRQVSFVKADNV